MNKLRYKADTVLRTLNNIFLKDKTNEHVFSIKRIPLEWIINFTKKDFQLELSSIEMELILEKLIHDGNVKRVQEMNPVQLIYYITYDGIVFIENGGYGKKSENDQRQNRLKDRNELLLIVGSWLAGIGAILFFSVEVWRICHPGH